MNITVNKESPVPLYWQISDQIKELILSGKLTDNVVLPSERVLAERLGVHRNTVIKAYSRLKDDDLIDSVQGVGYRVACSCGQEEQDYKRKINWSSIIKDEYQDIESTFDDYFQHFAEENLISFSTGMPPSVYDESLVAADLAEILIKENRKPFYLTPYQGDLHLRQQILAFLRTKGIRASAGQIQVLSETNQALDFIVTAMLKPGDKVLIEEPVSPDVYRVIELAGCHTVTVPQDKHGILCEHLEALIELHKPKFLYLNCSFHDPSTRILSIERRKKILEISNRYRLPVIEEDAASELAFGNGYVPVIKSMDFSENIIYIYSFSLTFIPGLSMAFVVGPEKLIKSLSYLVSIRMMSLDWMTQKLLAKYLENGTYYKNLEQMKTLNQEKCALMSGFLDRLKPYGLTYELPQGGVYIWCRLPSYIDSREVTTLCEKRGVAMMPGTIFYPKKNGGQNYIRLNFSFESKERIKKGMEIFTEVIRSLIKNV